VPSSLSTRDRRSSFSMWIHFPPFMCRAMSVPAHRPLYCIQTRGYTRHPFTIAINTAKLAEIYPMPHRIAVFNHSANILLLIASVLKQKGFEVFVFLEALTDVSRVVELNPDLVIIGHVTGFVDDELDIIRQFRNNPTTEHVPIIVCTTGAAQVRNSGGLNGVSYITIVP